MRITTVLFLVSLCAAAACSGAEPAPVQDIFCPVDASANLPDAAVPADTWGPEDAGFDVSPVDVAGLCFDDPGSFGCPCGSNADCEEGWCVEGTGGYICTKTCLTECPSGYDCKSVYGGTDLVFLCVPRVLSLCTPCSEDLQCNGGACLVTDGEGQCAYGCEVDSDCPMGFGCLDGPEGGTYCQPSTGSCSCNALTDGGQRTCDLTNALGACYGVETCDPDLGWAGCDAKEPVEETCDGADNDCDGFVDEDLPVEEACLNVVPGLGACEGTKTCFGPLGWSCQAPTPEVEICDYKDNDCDDAVDEDFTTAGVYDTFEHCGACNSDCGNQLSNATETACAVFGGAAQCIVVTCQQGFTKVNDFQCAPNVATLCQPCATADNCLGVGSACVELQDGSFCGKACNGPADCDTGYSCQAVGAEAMQCIPFSGSCGCDGGNTDLSKACSVTHTPADPNQPAYTCNGMKKCTDEGWAECSLATEDCDGVDNDCDGAVDEDFKNAVGQYLLVDHCGGCNFSCWALGVANSNPYCSSEGGVAHCSFTCEGGFMDVNKDPTDGCECKPEVGDDLAGDGVDSDCDGIDGEQLLGVFVAKNGNDLAAGTLAAPVLTISEGLSRAKQFGKRDVYVATGVYSESLELVPEVGLFGGYSSDFGVRDPILFETAIIGQSPTGPKPAAVTVAGVGDAGDTPITVLDGFTVFGANAAASLGATKNSYAVYVLNCGSALELRANRIYGGAGGAGSPGGKGGDGVDGVTGGPGANAKDLDKFTFNGNRYCTDADEVMGGGGGVLACSIAGAITGTDVNGGQGGAALCPSFGEDPGADQWGASGAPANGGAGGSAGFSLLIQSNDDCSFCAIPAGEGASIDAGLGTPGPSGSWGASGAACVDSEGVVVGGHWRSFKAQDGANGLHGAGGGGGGAGGGVEVTGTQCISNAGFEVDVAGSDLAGSGGGGGSGGCAGAGGTGGSGGGGSFGVFISFEVPASTLPVLLGNQVQRGFGGPGGGGGGGGSGGVGGAGSPGGGSGQGSIITLCARGGAPGGQGGQGGHAGGAGGGCGGPSFALYVWQAGGGLDAAAYTDDNAFPAGGSGGMGGSGGSSAGNSGNAGVMGVSAATNL